MAERYSETIRCNDCKTTETVKFKDTNQGPDWYTDITSDVKKFKTKQIDDKTFDFVCIQCNGQGSY